jgi:hypothetical protein
MKSHPRRASGGILTKVLIFLLLGAVGGLSTGAKNSLYYPQTNSVHFLSAASKIKVPSSPQHVDRNLLQPVARVVASQPETRIGREEQTEAPPVQSVSVTVALQHRSPPLFLL